MNIGFFDLTRQHKKLKKELDRATGRVFARGIYTLGREVGAFEKAFASYIGTRHGVGVASGTDALTLGLKALGVGPREEVILPANAYPTAFGVALSGVKIRLVDCKKTDGTLDPEALKAAITKKTRAVVAVYLYGNVGDILSVRRSIALSKQKIFLVEDASQAHGARISSARQGIGGKKDEVNTVMQKVGSIGDIGCFSFYPTKNLGAYGDGGMVVTNDAAVAYRLRGLRMYGERARYESDEVSGVSRLDELQAAILRVKLGYLNEWNERRRIIAAYYRRQLIGTGDIVTMTGDTYQHGTMVIDNNIRNREDSGNQDKTFGKSSCHLFVIRTKHRDKLQTYLTTHGIATAIHYPVPIHLTRALRFLGYKKGDFPVAETLSREVLSLPIYPEITDTELSSVVGCIQAFFK